MKNDGIKNDAATTKRTGTQAIERAIAILRLFAQADVDLSLTEVARTVGLTTATTHRILGSLVRERLLTYEPAVERYQIGPDALLLFAAAAQRYGISAARAELEHLSALTEETTSLGVIDGGDTIVVLQVESSRPLRFSRPVGTRIPAHVSAMGKAILAFSDHDLEQCVADLGDFTPFTDHTITDRPAFLQELQSVRTRGWAINDVEQHDGVRALAVPIRQGEGMVRASLGLQAPVERLPDTRVEEMVATLQTTADRLAVHLEITF